MPAYTVHAPVAASTVDDADKFVFVRDGFHFWALVFGPLWLLWHRLWLVLIGYLVVTVALGLGLAVLGAGASARFLVFFLLAVLMGLEAASLRRWSYSRGKWRQIDFIVADDEEFAERRFFDRWAGDGEVSRPPHDPSASYQPRAAASHGVIGLFPEPGGAR